MTPRHATATLLVLAAACTPAPDQAGSGADQSAQPAQIDKAKLHGVWQIMTVRNLETGEVDSIANDRTIWTHYTDSHWTYVWMDAGREGTTPAEFAALTPEAQHAENRAKMLDDEGEWRFWGSGGEWWLDGDMMGYTNVVSIEPYQVQMGGLEKVVYVNDTAYAYHTVAADGEAVQEYTHRRLDTMGELAVTRQGDIDPADLRGNWQITSTRNLATGEVDQVWEHRTAWFHVTDTHWTYVWMKKGRPVVTPGELGRMAPEARVSTRYAQIWDDRNEPVFWASGGTYSIVDSMFVVGPRVLSIEPHWIGVEGEEPITRLDRDAYVYLSPPRADGTVIETTHRRID